MATSQAQAGARSRDRLGPAELVEMYRHMMGERILAEISRSPDAPIRAFLVGVAEGQEAIGTGSCMALRRKSSRSDPTLPDFVVGNYGRSVMGLTYREILVETVGKAGGPCSGKGGPIHLAKPELGIMSGGGIVGEPAALATGFGFYAKYKKTGQVVITFFGDGASNNGLFHEGLNLAAIYKLPVVFLCVNNLYAFTTPLWKSTSVKQIADRAVSYAIPGVTVDGNDVLAVYDAVKIAADRARVGEGPSLVECMTFRWVGPTETGEEKSRPVEEVEQAKQQDPVNRFRSHLLDKRTASERELAAIDAALKDEIDAAYHEAAAAPWPADETLFEGVSATPIEVRR